MTIWALDWDSRWRRFEFIGEYASVSLDVPSESGIFQDSQSGIYGQINAHFGQNWLSALPNSVFTGVVRYDLVDYDTDTDGDSIKRITFGLNFRPEENTVFKLDYQRSAEIDPFDNPEVKGAALLFSAATYF